MFQIISHRVNSIDALVLAAKQSVGCEFDVQRTQTGELVLYHNRFVDMQRGQGQVKEFSLTHMQWQPNPDQPDHMTITLESLLEHATTLHRDGELDIEKFLFFVELKSDDNELAIETLELFASFGMVGANVVMISFLPAHLKNISLQKKQHPDRYSNISIGLDYTLREYISLEKECLQIAAFEILPGPDDIKQLLGFFPDYVIADCRMFDRPGAREMVDLMRKNDMLMGTFTPNSVDDLAGLVPDLVITDFPQTMQA